MPDGATIVLYSGLLIGLVYGAVALLSGFCLMSSLRGWWAEGDSRLVRTYALALGVAIATAQLLAAAGLVDLGKSIYLQPSFSAPLMFAGGYLKPFPIHPGAIYSLEEAKRAYLAVAGSSRDRIILKPQ